MALLDLLMATIYVYFISDTLSILKICCIAAKTVYHTEYCLKRELTYRPSTAWCISNKCCTATVTKAAIKYGIDDTGRHYGIWHANAGGAARP